MEKIKELVDWSATGIEILTVVAVIVSITFGSVRFLMHLNLKVDDAYQQYRTHLGKMLILALELLVAADIIRTVVFDPSLTSVAILAALVLVRTFLSWSLSVELEGCWPWAKSKIDAESEAAK